MVSLKMGKYWTFCLLRMIFIGFHVFIFILFYRTRHKNEKTNKKNVYVVAADELIDLFYFSFQGSVLSEISFEKSEWDFAVLRSIFSSV